MGRERGREGGRKEGREVGSEKGRGSASKLNLPPTLYSLANVENEPLQHFLQFRSMGPQHVYGLKQ